MSSHFSLSCHPSESWDLLGQAAAQRDPESSSGLEKIHSVERANAKKRIELLGNIAKGRKDKFTVIDKSVLCQHGEILNCKALLDHIYQYPMSKLCDLLKSSDDPIAAIHLVRQQISPLTHRSPRQPLRRPRKRVKYYRDVTLRDREAIELDVPYEKVWQLKNINLTSEDFNSISLEFLRGAKCIDNLGVEISPPNDQGLFTVSYRFKIPSELVKPTFSSMEVVEFSAKNYVRFTEFRRLSFTPKEGSEEVGGFFGPRLWVDLLVDRQKAIEAFNMDNQPDMASPENKEQSVDRPVTQPLSVVTTPSKSKAQAPSASTVLNRGIFSSSPSVNSAQVPPPPSETDLNSSPFMNPIS